MRKLLCLLRVHIHLSLFNKRKNISHTENSACHSVRIKLLQIREFFSNTYIEYRLTCNGTYGKSRTASGVTVKLCKYYSGDIKLCIESLGYIYGILTCHGIHYQDDVINIYIVLNLNKLVHHIFIYMQTSCSINEYNIVAILFGILYGLFCNLYRLMIRSHLKDRHIHLLTVSFQLLYSGRPVDITTYKKWRIAFFL